MIDNPLGPVVDLMLVAPGVYYCAFWCDDGVTSIRGNFCPKCSWNEAFVMACYGMGIPSHLQDMFQVEVFDRVGLHLL